LEDYSIDMLDVAHFAAAVTIAGEIVRSFDDPHLGEMYFNEIDSAAFIAAKKIFPRIVDFQLFRHMQVYQEARFCWNHQDGESVQAWFDQLQCALG